jgi:hypothetical protein
MRTRVPALRSCAGSSHGHPSSRRAARGNTLQAAEIRRSANRPTNDLTAYDLYLRALPHVFSQERDRYALALDLLGRAIERDPHYGSALAHALWRTTTSSVTG